MSVKKVRVQEQSATKALAVLLLAIVLTLSACGREEAEPSTTEPPTTSVIDCVAAGTCPDVTEDTQPTDAPTPAETVGTYNGLSAGFTDDGYPYLGDLDAPVSLVEFSDYLCPFCSRHATQTNPQLLERYAGSGQVRFVFRDYPLAELHPTAASGHAASLCVAEQGAPLFWAMHDQLFARQSEWASLSDNSEYMAAVAEQVGADLDAYRECWESGRTISTVDGSVVEARQLGFSGTPGFHIVDNRTGEIVEVVGAQPVETFVAAIEAVITGESPTATEPPEDKPDLPFWATEEGLTPDPDRTGYNLAGDPYRGNPDAELVVVEVSDFQCPYCQRHSVETQPLVDDKYVDSGQVMWVFKHMPLPFHPQALAAATAAECAGDQESFWEMHDLLFERVDDWAVDPPDPVLVDLAGELGLDEGAFASCVGSRTALEQVVDDLYSTSEVFSSTPTFVVIFDGWASVIDGAQPYEEFAAAFGDLLGQ